MQVYRRGCRWWRSDGVCLSSSRSLRRLEELFDGVGAEGGATEARPLETSAYCPWEYPAGGTWVAGDTKKSDENALGQAVVDDAGAILTSTEG